MEPYESKWTDDREKRMIDKDRHSLYPLSQLPQLEVSDHDPDVRGWEVCDKDGNTIGEVEELIVDPDLLKVRYLNVEVEDELSSDKDSHHLLIPIGAACVDCDDDKVVLENISSNQIRNIPSFTGKGIDKEFETELRRTFLNLDPGSANPSPGTDYNTQDFYGSTLFHEDRFYAPRRDMINLPQNQRWALRKREGKA